MDDEVDGALFGGDEFVDEFEYIDVTLFEGIQFIDDESDDDVDDDCWGAVDINVAVFVWTLTEASLLWEFAFGVVNCDWRTVIPETKDRTFNGGPFAIFLLVSTMIPSSLDLILWKNAVSETILETFVSVILKKLPFPSVASPTLQGNNFKKWRGVGDCYKKIFNYVKYELFINFTC